MLARNEHCPINALALQMPISRSISKSSKIALTMAMQIEPVHFGNLNCVLFFREALSHLPAIYDDVTKTFLPDEIVASRFDLTELEMKDFDISNVIEVDNSIGKIIFHRSDEQIIVDYFQNQIFIEHLFRVDKVKTLNGSLIISKYFKAQRNCVGILGFELSIQINSFIQSLTDNAADKSLHPIIVFEKSDDSLVRKEYVSDDSLITKQKMGMLKEYSKLFRLNDI